MHSMNSPFYYVYFYVYNAETKPFYWMFEPLSSSGIFGVNTGPAEGILELWGGGGLNRSRKDESSSGIPGARSRGKILKFKSSEMAGNESSKPIYIDKRPIKELKGLKDSRSIIIHYYTEKLITLATKLNASGQLQKL